MSWKAKASLVLLLTIISSVFMYQGWYKPNMTTAAIAQSGTWTSLYASTSYPTGSVTNSYTVNAGTNRLLVVAIASTRTSVGSQTMGTVSWNGVTMTQASGDASATGTPNHTYLYYLKDSQMPATTTTGTVSVSISGGTSYYTYVYATVFTGVDQTSPLTSVSNFNSSAADSSMGPFTSLTSGAGDQTIAVTNNARTSASTSTPRTISSASDSNWSTAAVSTSYYSTSTSGYGLGFSLRNRAVTTASTGDTNTYTLSGTAWDSMTAMAIKVASAVSGNLSITGGTNPASANAAQASTGNAINGFNLAMSAGTGTVSTLTVTGGTQFTATNIAGIKVYRDTGSPGTTGVLDATDTLVPSSYTISGNTATVTFTTGESVSTTGGNYLLALDIASTATVGNTITATVTGATGTGLGTVSATDSSSATLTITAGAGLTGNDVIVTPAAANAPQGSSNNLLDGFSLVSSTGTATINTVTLAGNTSFTATNVNGISVYADNGTVGTFDGADTLIPTTYTLSGNNATITFTTPQSVSTTVKNYLVMVNLPATATLAATLTGKVNAATGSGFVTSSFAGNTTGATLTVTAPQTLTVGNGTNPASANIKTSGTAALDAFTLALNTGTGSVNTLTLTGSANFNATNIAGVSVYADNGTVGTFEAGTDTLIPTSYTLSGSTATISFTTSEPVDTTVNNYLIVVTATGGATLNQTFTGTVTAVGGTGLGTPSYGDSGSATLTLVSGPVASITSCNSCHFKNGVADGTGRNLVGQEGLFQGAHGKHAGNGAGQANIACTKCHVNNTAYNHTNGNIDMANPINGNTSGAYTKGTSFAVNNGVFTGGTCSNVYCHSNGTGGTLQTGDTRGIVSVTSPNWGTGTTGCTSCHNTPPNYTSYTSATVVTGQKANSHQGATHASKTCDTCHSSVATTDGGLTYTTYTTHNNGRYNIKASLGYTYGSRGGTCSTAGCHGTAKWGGKLGCTVCHGSTTLIVRTKGRPNTTLANVVAEFNSAWNHKSSAGGVVKDADCIVCHLEGDSATQKPSAKHQDGNIDLRDPDGATAEAAITNMSGAAFTFQRFTTTYVAGSRTTTGQTSNNVDNVITQKFCLKCHDGNGARNTGARVPTTGTAAQPFGVAISRTTYYTYPMSAGANGVVNVFSQFSTGNRSFHPVRGPQNNSYAQGTKMVAPYGVTKTNGTMSNGVVMNCFDCHNVSGAKPLTIRTVAAHGNAETIRGTATVTGTPSSTNKVGLCPVCHAGYNGTANSHGTGSAFNTSTDSGMTAYVNYGCNKCHSGGYDTAVPRPLRGEDVHGSNKLGTIGTLNTFTSGQRWATDATPVAFIRNRQLFGTHQPAKIGTTTYSAACMGGTTGTCSRSVENYTPGGVY